MDNKRLNELLVIKKNNLRNVEDKEKYDFIVELFKDKNCFFNIPMEIVIGIFEFLVVGVEEALDLYFELTSIENYDKNMPKERFNIINNKK